MTDQYVCVASVVGSCPTFPAPSEMYEVPSEPVTTSSSAYVVPAAHVPR
jgi:hypothetical protein